MILLNVCRYGGWSFEADNEKPQSMNAKVWFNNRGYHAMPAFYNSLSNAILRASVTGGNPAEYGITAYNHPFILSRQQLNQDTL